MTMRSQITHVHTSPEGILVTFGDGHTFLFPDIFLFESRLKSGQMMESREPEHRADKDGSDMVDTKNQR